MKLSVIICTHNPREDYLQRTLDALKDQTFPKEEWELLLIDNACKEPLSEKWDLSWHPNSIHIREEELGLTPARLRGITESNGEILVFVDDDNLLSSDYLQEAWRISHNHPTLGCWGAAGIQPLFEEEPTPELMPFMDRLAIRVVPKTYWSNHMADGNVPWGAGLVVRKNVAWEFFRKFNNKDIIRILGRSGDVLNSGEDDEFSWTACEMGYGKGIFTELRLTHLINKKRTQIDYLTRITEGHGYSHTILCHIHKITPPNDFVFSQPSDIIVNLLRFKFSTTLYHLNFWWFNRNKPRYEKLFRKHWSIGIKKAKKDVGIQ